MSSRLTQGQVLEIGTFLRQVCQKDTRGYAVYIEPWSDAEVAKKFHVVSTSIASLRKNLIGKLEDGPGGQAYLKLATRIELLERRVDVLARAASNLVNRK